VKIIATALADLRGIWRLRWGLLTGSIGLPPAACVPGVGQPGVGQPGQLEGSTS
jgi:hypothetical protein